MIGRRTLLLNICAAGVLATTSCSTLAPMDEDAVNNAVSQVEGVTSVNIAVESRGIADWSLAGEIGLPDDPDEARTVYENCLRAIASVPVRDSSTVGIYVYGVSASEELNPQDVGAPDDTRSLKEHFN